MAKDKDKAKKTEEKTGKTEPSGVSYVCITPHEKPINHPDGSRGFRKFKAGAVEIFDKNPGPYWRPEEEIKKTKEVTDNGAG